MRHAIIENREILRKMEGGGDIVDPPVVRLVAGDGIDITPTMTEQTISADIGAGLEFVSGEIAINLASPSGVELSSDELRIDVNDGCEIVADGLNAETTAASIVQTGGDNDDPAIRNATSLGTSTTNNDIGFQGCANVTVTRTSTIT